LIFNVLWSTLLESNQLIEVLQTSAFPLG